MANSAQAKKRIRQAVTATLANQSCLSRVRTHRKNAEIAISKADHKKAMEQLKMVVIYASRAAKKNLLTKNKVARIVSRLNSKIKNSKK